MDRRLSLKTERQRSLLAKRTCLSAGIVCGLNTEMKKRGGEGGNRILEGQVETPCVVRSGIRRGNGTIDSSNDQISAHYIIDVHGRKAAGVARDNARTAALAGPGRAGEVLDQSARNHPTTAGWEGIADPGRPTTRPPWLMIPRLLPASVERYFPGGVNGDCAATGS